MGYRLPGIAQAGENMRSSCTVAPIVARFGQMSV